MHHTNQNTVCHVVLPHGPSYKGRGTKIDYGYGDTAYGSMLLAVTSRRLCYAGFVNDGDRQGAVAKMKKHIPFADFFEKDGNMVSALSYPLELHGTLFQQKVWRALREIASGETVHYQDIAKTIGQPKAVRAVGSAVGANPVSVLVPCHRVVPVAGGIGNYAWGAEIKKRLLDKEAGNTRLS